VRRLVANGVLAGVSVVFCLGVAEVGARLVDALRVRGEARALADLKPFSRHHPLLGWEKNPGAERHIRRPEIDVHMAWNAHGQRGPERDYVRPPGVRRVLLIGDSFAAGYYAEEPETLRAVLEAQLARSCGGPIEVLNGGTGAYSTDQEYLYYQSEGQRFGAEVVVLLFYYNDLAYNLSPTGVSGEAKPFFTLDGERLVLQNTPIPAPVSDKPNRQNPGVSALAPWHGSIALRMLSDRTADSAPRLHRFLSRLGLVQPVSSHPSRELTVYGLAPETPSMWRVTEAILAALEREVAGHGARLVVLHVPARFEVNDGVWELTRERYQMGRRWDRNRVFERLKVACERIGVPLVDPREGLRRAEASPAPAYYTRDTHWNAVGNRVAAEALLPAAREALRCAGEPPAR
jgi:hypothetical protein